jgi:hypothetical protein
MLQTDLRSPLLRRIDQLARLQDGWNGEDSRAPLPQTLERLRNLIDALPRFALRLIQDPEHDLYADSDGDLLLEWALADGQIVAGIITQPEGWSGYFFDRNDEPTDLELSSDLDLIVKAFKPILETLERVGNLGEAYYTFQTSSS